MFAIPLAFALAEGVATQHNITRPEMPAQGSTLSESNNDTTHPMYGILNQTMTGKLSGEKVQRYAEYLATLSWQNKSHAERDVDVAQKWGEHTIANRRRLQGAGEDNEIMQLMREPTAWCDDELATNVGRSGVCLYDCQELQNYYFPSEESRCFLYDATIGGWPPKLLDDWPIGMKRARQDAHEYVDSTSVTMNQNNIIRFTISENSGKCTDVLIRIATIAPSSQLVRWHLDDGDQNGPWNFEVPVNTIIHEYTSCMADNSFTLAMDAATGAGWEGTIAVVGYTEFHGTIVVPNDENWIFQGVLGEDGVPIKLDARISSGSIREPSEASIVLRHIRFSGQQTPRETPRDKAARTDWLAGARDAYTLDASDGESRLGGAFKYDGGGLDPDVHIPKLIFEHLVFDHNNKEPPHGVTGTAIAINGRAMELSSFEVIVNNCLFLRNIGVGCGGAFRFSNSVPSTLLINNTNFVDNEGYCYPHMVIWGSDPKVGVAGLKRDYFIVNTNFIGPSWCPQNCGPLLSPAGLVMRMGFDDGALSNMVLERVTITNSSGDTRPGTLVDVFGARMNVTFREVRVAGIIARDGGSEGNGNWGADTHATAITIAGWPQTRLVHLILEGSGAESDLSRGNGVLALGKGMDTGVTPAFSVEDSIFMGNRAARGGAIALEVGHLTVHRCLFEVRRICEAIVHHIELNI
jgi:hypothetical protein